MFSGIFLLALAIFFGLALQKMRQKILNEDSLKFGKVYLGLKVILLQLK